MMQRHLFRRCFTTHAPRFTAATTASPATGVAATAAATAATATTSAHRLPCAQLLDLTAREQDGVEGKDIRLSGYIKSIRKQKKYAFAQITDGSSIDSVQAIFSPSPELSKVTDGSAVSISGTWTRCPPGKKQSHELVVSDVKVLGASDPATYPIQKKYHTPEFLRSHPHLRLRTPFNSLLTRFKSEALFAVSSAFHYRPDGTVFYQVQPPLITSGDCEGAGEVFTVTTRAEQRPEGKEEEPFFRSPRYLTVSSQLHLETFSAALGNVWTMSPTFRAEKSDTPRHLSEFYMLEAEMQFLDGGLDELLDQTEGIIRDITAKLAGTKAAKEILAAKRSGESGQDEGADDMLQQRWNGILHPSKWPRVTYTEAIAVLQEAVDKGEMQFVYPPTWGNALQFEHEKYIVEKIGGSGSGRPVFITHYPKASKPFYMLPSSIEEGYEEEVGDKATVGAFDLILPGIGEILGGSMREHRLPNLIQNMRENGLIKKATEGSEGTDAELYPYLEAGESLEPLQWYADLRRWGSAPHGGWGLGFDRFLGYLSGVGNLRDVVAFPRYAGKADC